MLSARGSMKRTLSEIYSVERVIGNIMSVPNLIHHFQMSSSISTVLGPLLATDLFMTRRQAETINKPPQIHVLNVIQPSFPLISSYHVTCQLIKFSTCSHASSVQSSLDVKPSVLTLTAHSVFSHQNPYLKCSILPCDSCVQTVDLHISR